METITDFGEVRSGSEFGERASIAKSARRGEISVKLFPLSRNQIEIYLEQKLHPDTSIFTIGAELRGRGCLNIDIAVQALVHCLRRSPALRSVVVETDAGPRQGVIENYPFGLEVFDFSLHEDPEQASADFVKRHFAAPMSFRSDSPLAFVTILQAGEDRFSVYTKFHHIAVDGWATSLFHADFIKSYNSLIERGTLPDIPINHFSDYLDSDAAYFNSDQFRGDQVYWREKFSTPLPRLFTPLRSFTETTSRVSTVIERPLYDRIIAFAKAEGASPFHFILAVLIGYLGRTSRVDRLAIGLPILNRRTAEAKRTLGLFASVSPLVMDVAPDRAFRTAMAAVRAELRRDYRHQRLPLSEIRRAPPTRGDNDPLFDVTLSYEKHDYSDRFVDCEHSTVVLNSPQQLLPLKIFVREFDDTRDVTVDFDFNLTYLTPERAADIAAHFVELIRSALDTPDSPTGQLEFLTPAERRRLTSGIHANRPVVRATGSLVEWFERMVAERGEAPAVSFEGTSLSYAALNGAADRLADRLIARGVRSGDRVGLCFERHPDLIVAVLAVLKAGGAYVPLDPRYPLDRLAYLIADSGMGLIVTHAPALGTLTEALVQAERTVPVVRVEADEAAPAAPRPVIHPDQPAYVIYTSGSTGRPKGCVVSHQNVTRLMASTEPLSGFGPDDVWTLFHSFAFDFSVWEIWGPLLYGGRLVIVPHWVSRAPDAFVRLLADEGVTVLNQTPSAFRQLIPADAEVNRPLALRWVVFGGEALELQSLRPWYERHGDRTPTLVNMYGITETTVHVTWRPLAWADVTEGRGSVIGVPLDDLTVYLLDDRLEPVPLGVTGEIFVGGAGVATGYLNRPELTAERFIPDPFGAPGARLYRSGDLARRLPDGGLDYLGRADHQVKIRGFRIEPGEIEAALVAHPAVREALVLAVPGAAGDPRLVAWFVADAGLDTGGLRTFLAQRLPDHMIPAAFVRLDAFPLTVNGKIDRKALPDPTIEVTHAVSAPPETPAQEALVEVWKEVLNLSAVGIDDNFFAVGGDSILSLQIVAKARKRGLDFTIRELFANQTVRTLAAALESASTVPTASPEPAPAPPFGLLDPADRDRMPDDALDAYPLTSLQAGMLFHSDLNSGTAIFHDIFSYRLSIPWRDGAWERAAAEVANAHPALRTTYHWTGFSIPVQIVHRDGLLPVVLKDLRGIAHDERNAVIEADIAAEKERGFQPDRLPLFRLIIHRRGDEDVQITTSFHHVNLDGWSVATLLTELIGRYIGRIPTVSSFPRALARFVELERRVIADPEARAFWSGRLSGLEPTRLPRSVEGPAPDGDRVARLIRTLPIGLTERLQAVADGLGVPLKSVALVAHLRALAFASGVDEAVTGYVTHGRPEEAGAHDALGLFLNTLPLRLSLRGGRWSDAIRAAFAEECAVLSHRRFPTGEIKRLNDGVLPYEAGFNFIHFHVYNGILDIAGFQVLDVRVFEETDFPFLAQFSRHPASRELELTLVHDRRLFTQERINALSDTYLRVLEAIANAPDTPISSVPLMDAAERTWLTSGVHANRPVVRATGSLVEWFERVAAERGEAPAVSFEGTSLSYAALNAAADRLADRLIARGVRSGDRVGLCFERHPDLIVAVLAVLKAGGAYVPLDPRYPLDRLAYLIADSGMGLIVTHAPALGTLTEALVQAERTVPVVRVEADEAAPAAPRPVIHPDQPAYVIYTSGSTGRPKGCVVSHQNVTRLMASSEPLFGFGPDDVWTLFHSFAFDFSVWEIWGPLLYGGRLVIVPHWVSRAPDAFVRLLADEGVTVLNQTPSAFRQLIPADAEVNRPLALRWVVFGGEALELQSLRPWYERHGDRTPTLVNMYGITETTVHVTWRPLAWADVTEGRGSVIGGPLDDLTVYLLDDRLEPVPLGVTGEIFVGGAGVATGYLNRPELTAERFIPDPFGAPGARLYRSGDLARRLPDGGLDYLGRADHQVKIRGFRIEPGEIEAALVAHPAVREALVLAVPGAAGDPRLVAWFVADADAGLDTGGLRTFLAQRLPDHMIPAAFVRLDAFLLTVNGKIDRKALPDPKAGADPVDRVAPRSALEETLATLCAEVLEVPAVGVLDDFFTLGGNSILATRYIAKVRAALGRDLPLRLFFERPNIAALAEALEQLADPPAAAPKAPIRRARRSLTAITQLADGSLAPQPGDPDKAP